MIYAIISYFMLLGDTYIQFIYFFPISSWFSSHSAVRLILTIYYLEGIVWWAAGPLHDWLFMAVPHEIPCGSIYQVPWFSLALAGWASEAFFTLLCTHTFFTWDSKATDLQWYIHWVGRIQIFQNNLHTWNLNLCLEHGCKSSQIKLPEPTARNSMTFSHQFRIKSQPPRVQIARQRTLQPNASSHCPFSQLLHLRLRTAPTATRTVTHQKPKPPHRVIIHTVRRLRPTSYIFNQTISTQNSVLNCPSQVPISSPPSAYTDTLYVRSNRL